MNLIMKEMQKRVLALFSKETREFALAGGTALEIYYLHHRFSWDLDFLSPRFEIPEINRLITVLKKSVGKNVALESESMFPGQARVRFYSLPVNGATRPLKIDFVEDVISKNPKIENIGGVNVYSAADIYLHKIAAITGTQMRKDPLGREVHHGRNEARDIFDLYELSLKIQPLHFFLKKISPLYQKGIVHWYRSFSRQDVKLALLDIDIYDPNFNSRDMIGHLDNEIKLFMKGVLGK